MNATICPNCVCGGGCDIASDDFNRSDGTDIDTGSSCGWTEVSGSWSISSNTLQCTSAGIAKCDTASDNTLVIVQATVSHTTSGSSCDLIFNYDDSDNYFYVRYTFGTSPTGKIQIKRKSGGSHFLLSTKNQTVTNGDVGKVCVHTTGRITAYLNGTAVLGYYGTTPSSTGYTAGLGADGSGTATFDDFSYVHAYQGAYTSCESCADGGCDGCSFTPETITVTVSGSANGTCTGSPDCTVFDGTHVLDLQSAISSYCRYTISLSTPCGGLLAAGIIVTLQTMDGNPQIDVEFNYSGALFRYTTTSGIGCDSINVSVPFDSGLNGQICTMNSATVTVSS